MGLAINRKAQRLATSGPESITLQSACYDHIRLVDGDRRPDLTIEIATFTDEQDCLNRDAVKPLFDYIWKETESDKRSNVLLELSGVQAVNSLFRTELAYLSSRLRQQSRSVRLSGVGFDGDWDSWL